jgi:hypothetical protein
VATTDAARVAVYQVVVAAVVLVVLVAWIRPVLGQLVGRVVGLSLCVNGRRPAGAAACGRFSHGVAVLLKVYANCLDGQGEIANGRIEAALVGRAWSGTLVLGVEAVTVTNSPSAGQLRDAGQNGSA